MKLSWSQKLFLRINKTVGKRPWLDKIMYFCGQWLIFVLAVCAALSVGFEYLRSGSYYLIIVAALAFFITYILSYVTAMIFHHPRPIRELPHVKELIIPIENWKSFPSDHTIAAILFTLIIFVVFDETSFETISFAISSTLAVLIMSGRVYCGVHYPRDILGGIVFALVGALLTISICSRYFFGF